jgi:hypothetical protein
MDSAWWGMATITTVGYGDVRPTSAPGRLMGAMFMVLGIACFSLITAEISTVLTLNALSSSVSSLKDLAGNVVCTTAGDIGQAVLQQANAGSRLVYTHIIDDCYAGLANGTVDAVVRCRRPARPAARLCSAHAGPNANSSAAAGLRRPLQRVLQQQRRRLSQPGESHA